MTAAERSGPCDEAGPGAGAPAPGNEDERPPDSVCPVCGGPLHHERCKVVCRSRLCGYRIIMTCAEF